MQRKKRGGRIAFILAVLALILLAAGAALLPGLSRRYFYPTEYGEFVYPYAEEYGVDPYLVFAVIKTESNFDPSARSNVGARGLMQIMEDTFDWLQFRMGDDSGTTYDDMLNAEDNIRYGAYMLRLLDEEYTDLNAVIAAYHAGRGQVNQWLSDPAYSGDGVHLEKTPSRTTNHYISKVEQNYQSYLNLYQKERNG